jgi:hypothetical protein
VIITISVFIVLISFLTGYILGRRTGSKEGRELGILYTPLLLRAESLKNGKCAICMSSIDCQKSSSMIE